MKKPVKVVNTDAIVVGDENVNVDVQDEQDVDTEIVDDDVTITDEVKEEEVEATYPELDTVTIVDIENSPVESKRVKVRLKANHRFCVGGEWYNLSKGEVSLVTENVKSILAEADLLLPL